MNIPKRYPEPAFPDNLNTKIYHEKGIDAYSNAIQFTKQKEILSDKLDGKVQNILDVCGGSGTFANSLLDVFAANAFVVDNSQLALSQLEGRFKHKSIVGVNMSAYDIIKVNSFKDSFDLVSCIDALHELDIETAIENMAYAVRPGGHVFIYDFNREFLTHPLYALNAHYQKLSAAREQYSEEEFVEKFPFIFNKLPTQKDIYWFSFQASYTFQEVISQLAKNNINLIHTENSVRGTYYLGQKNIDSNSLSKY